MKRKILCTLLVPGLQILLLPAAVLPETAEPDTIKARYVFNPVVVTATKIAGPQRDMVASVSKCFADRPVFSTVPMPQAA